MAQHMVAVSLDTAVGLRYHLSSVPERFLGALINDYNRTTYPRQSGRPQRFSRSGAIGGKTQRDGGYRRRDHKWWGAVGLPSEPVR